MAYKACSWTKFNEIEVKIIVGTHGVSIRCTKSSFTNRKPEGSDDELRWAKNKEKYYIRHIKKVTWNQRGNIDITISKIKTSNYFTFDYSTWLYVYAWCHWMFTCATSILYFAVLIIHYVIVWANYVFLFCYTFSVFFHIFLSHYTFVCQVFFFGGGGPFCLDLPRLPHPTPRLVFFYSD